MKIEANGISIEVEDTGGAGEPVLLIIGLGGQLIHFPDALVAQLVSAGYRVVRFDNRDAGLSQHFPEAGVPNVLVNTLRWWARLPVKTPYTLCDMAGDALGVLDALGLQWRDVAQTRLYTVHDLHPLFGPEFAARGALAGGLALSIF